MEKIHPNIKKMFLGVGIGTILLMIGIGIYSFIPGVVYEKKIKDWRFALFTNVMTGETKDHADKQCPMFGSYPIFIDIRLRDDKRMKNGKKNIHQKKTNREEFLEGLKFWNKEGKKAGLKGKLVELYSNSSVENYRLRNPETIPKLKMWPIVVKVNPVPEDDYGINKSCQMFYHGQKEFLPDSLGKFSLFKPKNGILTGGVISVCEKAYNWGVGHNEYGMGVIKNKGAAKLRSFRLSGISAHEIGHVIFGTGEKSTSNWFPRGHAPIRVGGIMAKSPNSLELTRHMRTLLKNRVLDPCRKNKRILR